MNDHLIRIGMLGQVGRFESPTGAIFSRGRRVICRTGRGLEVGQVLATPDFDCEQSGDGQTADGQAPDVQTRPDCRPRDGAVLRLVTPEDDLLLARLERFRQEAFVACDQWLKVHAPSALLVDVEHLFDGQSLYFYFLGPVSPELEALTSQLASLYETKVEFRRFTETLEKGCGPACGTEEASGCGTSCGSCSLAAACAPR